MNRRKTSQPPESQNRRWAQLILQVQNGQMKAKEAARQMGVSRKTYYKWEKRVLQAIMEALEIQRSGRPAQVEDPQKVELQQQVQKLQAQLNVLQQTVAIRQLLASADKKKAPDSPKDRENPQQAT